MKKKIQLNNMAQILLISEDYIKSTTNISDNMSGEYILPAIQLAQDIALEETIGSPLLSKLQELVETAEIQLVKNENYKLLLDKYIQPFLCYATIAQITVPIAFKMANAGVLRTDDEKMTNVSANEVDKVKSHYTHIADTYKYRLQRYLIANYNKFPELLKYKSIADLRANLYSAASCGLVLGGPRGKSLPMSTDAYFGYGLPSSTIDVN